MPSRNPAMDHKSAGNLEQCGTRPSPRGGSGSGAERPRRTKAATMHIKQSDEGNSQPRAEPTRAWNCYITCWLTCKPTCLAHADMELLYKRDTKSMGTLPTPRIYGNADALSRPEPRTPPEPAGPANR